MITEDPCALIKTFQAKEFTKFNIDVDSQPLTLPYSTKKRLNPKSKKFT